MNIQGWFPLGLNISRDVNQVKKMSRSKGFESIQSLFSCHCGIILEINTKGYLRITHNVPRLPPLIGWGSRQWAIVISFKFSNEEAIRARRKAWKRTGKAVYADSWLHIGKPNRFCGKAMTKMCVCVIFWHALSLGLPLRRSVSGRPTLGPADTKTFLLLSEITFQIGVTVMGTRSSG